jgi:hypothetical protein
LQIYVSGSLTKNVGTGKNIASKTILERLVELNYYENQHSNFSTIGISRDKWS